VSKEGGLSMIVVIVDDRYELKPSAFSEVEEPAKEEVITALSGAKYLLRLGSSKKQFQLTFAYVTDAEYEIIKELYQGSKAYRIRVGDWSGYGVIMTNGTWRKEVGGWSGELKILEV
jgi:hypothetical protein